MKPTEEDWQIADRNGRIFEMPDCVERLGPRCVKPIGRRDGAVKVGGYSVWPQRVERMLKELDGVANVAIRLGTNGRLKAFVVPQEGIEPDTLHTSLERFVAERLTSPERPKSFHFGDALPRNDMGKLADWS
ncbi:hypothetical protein JYU29_12065 [Tianweitania sp. BSSL-BM11]|uniref:AMP-binding enzyme C-terminal domain-containing protein n=1 Tax=Tianweitania aestuarii TaxID=2814886 RepID=A0ABS5RWK5_9HYPH|nr:hypothetical protein [Tianweitania aestuarii]MBS9721423.1 hypothetical protein [Tianweitania aestuarii]